MNPNVYRLYPKNNVQISNIDVYLEELLNKGSINLSKKDDSATIEAGQTYLGQMIAHDLVSSSHSNRGNASPFLNLDSLYGDSDNVAYFNENGKFILGNVYTRTKIIHGKDVIRSSKGTALIPDIRNDENVIISQLHLFWQKLHNVIIDFFQSKLGLNNHNDKARRITVLLFHEIVKHDYLRQVLIEEIYDLYFKSNNDFSLYYNNQNPYYAIPLEFSHAVFRFGHSMVRNSYVLNSKNAIFTKDMFSNRIPFLRDKDIISWGTFFNLYDYEHSQFHNKSNNSLAETIKEGVFLNVQTANKINPVIEISMRKIPIGPDFKDIRELNFKAGISKKIVYGDVIRKDILTKYKDKIGKNICDYLSTEKYNSMSDLSLWPYILSESEIAFSNKKGGLGIIGSIIVSEVLSQSMRVEASSEDLRYLNLFRKTIKENQNIVEYNRLKSEIKDEKILNQEYSKINNNINNSSIKMGYLINFINRGENKCQV